MKLNRFLKSLLKTAVYVLDQTSEQVERMSDRASDVVAEAKQTVFPDENHTLRNALSFAAGIGLGVGVGFFLAPASGAEVRRSIGEKVPGHRRTTDSKSEATGTDATQIL